MFKLGFYAANSPKLRQYLRIMDSPVSMCDPVHSFIPSRVPASAPEITEKPNKRDADV